MFAVQFPGRHTRAREPPPTSVTAAANSFWSRAQSSTGQSLFFGKRVAFYGQCIGGFFALHFAASYSRLFPQSPPVTLVTSACPSPDSLSVLTDYTSGYSSSPQLSRKDQLREGLHALTLAIGFSEDDWLRLSQNPAMYNALVQDVHMTDAEEPFCIPEGSNFGACISILGDEDPVVETKHVLGWTEAGAPTTTFITLPSLGHNIQYEVPLIQRVEQVVSSLP